MGSNANRVATALIAMMAPQCWHRDASRTRSRCLALVRCRVGSYGTGDAPVLHTTIIVETMKFPLEHAMVSIASTPTSRDLCWYEEDLSVEDLSATVAVINVAVRASDK